MQQDEYGNATNPANQIASSAELRQNAVETRSCSIEEIEKYRNLHQKHQYGNDHYQERVDGTFGDYGAQRLRE